MSDAERPQQPPSSAQPPASGPSRTASATARVFREMDMMRVGLDAVLRDVSTSQVILEGAPGLQLQDQIKVKLHHIVQRFEKEVRGVVRQIEAIDPQSERITVELFTRLTPVEVSVLKMGIDRASDDAKPKWY